MNTLRVVNTFLRSPNRYAGTFSRVMVSIHPDELCSLKDSVQTLETQLHKTSRQVNLLEVQISTLQNVQKYNINPQLSKLTEQINNISKYNHNQS